MEKIGRSALIGAILLLLCLATTGAVRAQTVFAGHDLLETDASATYDDLTDLDLPADFFGPGSDPFTGRVNFKGVPFATFDPDGPGPAPTFTDLLPTDTVVRRLANAGPIFPPAGDTIPIQIVQLSLVSVEPMKITFFGGAFSQDWNVAAQIQVNPGNGLVDPPQAIGTMRIRHEFAGGGTFDSSLPVQSMLTFTQVGGPGLIGPVLSPNIFDFNVEGESWSHAANPLIFPNDGESALDVLGLTSNFFPGCVCDACPPPRRSAVCYSVDGGVFNAVRNGLPLTPFPNPAEGLFQPFPPHVPPNDVYALGTAPGAQGYATEGEIFQSDGDPLGAPPDGSNVCRMSSALGVGPMPGGPPPFRGPFAPNPGAPIPIPPPPGGLGTFGLVPDDNVDSLSFGKDSGHVLMFSVDTPTLGIPGTDVRFQSVTSPFGGAAAAPFPTNPGGGDPGNESASDIFKSLPLAPFGSYIPLHLATGRYVAPAMLAANELMIDEVLLGLQAPALNGRAIAPPEDDLDGLEMEDAGDPIFGVDLVRNSTGIGPPDGIPDRHTFFSIDTASPSLVPGAIDADDVLVVPPGGFVFGVFADGTADIGLIPGDDIDALALSDVVTAGVMNPGADQALFSLHPGSPSVRFGPDGFPATGDERSAADIFVTSFTGTFAIYATPGGLGLLPTDNVNAIDIWPRDFPQPGVPRGGGGGGGKKKLSVEDAERAKHGIRISQKRRCNMTTTGNFTVTIFGFGTFPVNLNGPSSGMRMATEFDPSTGQTRIPIELLSMTLNGNSPVGPVTVSAGRELNLDPSPGAIHPASPAADFPGQSFFDVFVTIDLPMIGMTLHNSVPFHVQTPVNDFPPYGSTFQGNVPVQLFDAGGNPRGTLDIAQHRPRCIANTDCDDLNPCTIDTCQPGPGNCTHVALPDLDGDGVCDGQDNCVGVSNGGQGTLVFPVYPEMIRFTTKTQFCWNTPAAVQGVHGPLSGVSTYTVFAPFLDPVTTCHAAPEPIPAGGLYYLIKHNCEPGSSWQSTIGSEPGRDLSLP